MVDLTDCDREPIHIPGAIQPHGLLLAVDPETFDVAIASENCEQQTGIPHGRAVGGPLADVVGEGLAGLVRRRAAEQTFREPLIVRLPPGRGALAGEEVDVTLHRSGELLPTRHVNHYITDGEIAFASLTEP